MSASIVTLSNLGKKTNLKTADILPVIDTFAEKKILQQIICQINSGFYFSNTRPAIPTSLRYLLRALEKTIGFSLQRNTANKLFDFFATRKLRSADVIFFHPGTILPQSFRKARSLGLISVNIATTAHFQTNAAIEKREFELLGIHGYKGTYAEYERQFTHYNKFDYTIAISDFVKESYKESTYPSERVFVVHPDIDIKRFVPQEKSGETFKVLYVAYTTPLKGLHYLLEAWTSLNLANAELVLVGGYGAMPEELKKKYETHIHSNLNIKWIGHTRTPEAYYKDASVFVLPSLTEGNSHVLLEAMASGVPVITTKNAKGLVEDGKSGFVVPIRDPGALAEKILFLYHNRDVAERMGKESRKVIENKKPFGEAVFEIYQEIMKQEHKV